MVLLVQILLKDSNSPIKISLQQVTINFIFFSSLGLPITILKMSPILLNDLVLGDTCPFQVSINIWQPVQKVFYFGFALFQLLHSSSLDRKSSPYLNTGWGIRFLIVLLLSLLFLICKPQTVVLRVYSQLWHQGSLQVVLGVGGQNFVPYPIYYFFGLRYSF